MNTNVWKKIGYVICGSIGLSLSWYVFYSLFYKFGFEQTGPKIYNILCYTILNLVLLGLIFKKNEIKKMILILYLYLWFLE